MTRRVTEETIVAITNKKSKFYSKTGKVTSIVRVSPCKYQAEVTFPNKTKGKFFFWEFTNL